MEKWFERQSRLVQLILLLIPGVNWIVDCRSIGSLESCTQKRNTAEIFDRYFGNNSDGNYRRLVGYVVVFTISSFVSL